MPKTTYRVGEEVLILHVAEAKKYGGKRGIVVEVNNNSDRTSVVSLKIGRAVVKLPRFTIRPLTAMCEHGGFYQDCTVADHVD